LLVLGLVFALSALIPSENLTARWYGDMPQMRITQSISLSNIKPSRLIEKARPEAVKPASQIRKSG
jgi:hypothetical protein